MYSIIPSVQWGSNSKWVLEFFMSHKWQFNFNIALDLLQQITQIDNDLKARASAYNNLKGNLQNLERKNA